MKHFCIEAIKQAFFNYDYEGNELTLSEWEKRRNHWYNFEAYLFAHAEVVDITSEHEGDE